MVGFEPTTADLPYTSTWPLLLALYYPLSYIPVYLASARLVTCICIHDPQASLPAASEYRCPLVAFISATMLNKFSMDYLKM